VSGESSSFLSRWSRRKADVRRGADVETEAQAHEPVAATPPPAVSDRDPQATRQATAPVVREARAVQAAALADAPTATAPGPDVACPLPTLEDVARLTRESDYAPFVRPGVDAGIKNAALKKLFSDPHFNVMDGLDTYIDDYGKPDPIPAAMLRQLNQALSLGLFEASPAEPQGASQVEALAPADSPPASDVAAGDTDALDAPPAGDDDTAQPQPPALDPGNIRT
jgi:Protein of unknown function (DUF3306)